MYLNPPRPAPARARRPLARLARDASGLALIEFAFTLPIILATGLGGVELANLALANMRVSHAAIDLADNTARMGRQSTSTGYQVLSESDINDTLQALRLETSDVPVNGRVTVSSVEARTDANGKVTQFLHWQRCVGQQSGTSFDSTFGTAPTDDSGTTVTGIGSPALTAPPGSGLMFVEINYNYKPMFSTIPLLNSLLGSTRRLHYISAMIVRQTRSTYDAIDNTAQVTRMTCDKHAA